MRAKHVEEAARHSKALHDCLALGSGIVRSVRAAKRLHRKGKISSKRYQRHLSERHQGHTKEEWLRACSSHIAKKEQEVHESLNHAIASGQRPVMTGIALTVLALMLLSILGPSFTGLATLQPPVVEIQRSVIGNATIPLEFTGLRAFWISGEIGRGFSGKIFLNDGVRDYLLADYTLRPVTEHVEGSSLAFSIGEGRRTGNAAGLIAGGEGNDRACVVWEVREAACYGSAECCAFAGVEQEEQSWNDMFHVYKGRLGAADRSEVRAQLFIANYSLDPGNAFSDIRYSDISLLQVDTFEQLPFGEVCGEACALPGAPGPYTLRVEVEQGAIFLANASALRRPNTPPSFSTIPPVTLSPGGNVTLDLASLVTDLDGDSLAFSAYPAPGIQVEFREGKAIISTGNFTGTTYTFFTANDSASMALSNIFEIRVESLTNGSRDLITPRVVIGQPVRWVKEVSVEGGRVALEHAPLNATVWIRGEKLDSRDIRIATAGRVEDLDSYERGVRLERLTRELNAAKGTRAESVSAERASLRREAVIAETGKVFRKLVSGDITGRAVQDVSPDIAQAFQENETALILPQVTGTVEVEYYTEGPEVEEREQEHGKQVIVSSDIHYTDILAFTTIPDTAPERVKLYHLKGSGREEAAFDGYDSNGDGKVDYLEWIVPHLSNQTYEIVLITKAEHLNASREFIADIYDEVREQDGNWSPRIFHGEYVRVTFEIPLDEKRDITLYARNSQESNTTVEVYLENGSDRIAEFPRITREQYYKIFLTGMNGSHDTFDLRVRDASSNASSFLEFDHIIDPSTQSIFFSPPTPNDTSLIGVNETTINVSISMNSAASPGLGRFTFDWNGTNYSFYNESLVLLLNFNNVTSAGESEVQILDMSQHGNNVNLFMGPVPPGVLEISEGGRYGSGLFLEQSFQEGVQVDSNPPVNFSFGNTSFTLAAWVNLSSFGGGDPPLVGYYETPFAKYLLYYDQTRSNFSLKVSTDGSNEAAHIDSNSSGNPTGNWVFVVGFYDAENGKLGISVDGETPKTLDYTNGTYVADPSQILIGKSDSSFTFLDGFIDEVMVWNVSLSEEMITHLYRSNIHHVQQAGLFKNWTFLTTQPVEDGSYVYQGYASGIGATMNGTGFRTLSVDNTTPITNFTPPTPPNGSSVSSAIINVSVIEPNLASFTFNWNGTNTTHYNESLVLMLNLDNVSALGENSTFIKDVSLQDRNGTCRVCPSFVQGKYNGGFNFTNVSGEVWNVTDYPAIRLNSTISVAAWVYPYNSSTDGGSGSDATVLSKITVGVGGYRLKTNTVTDFTFLVVDSGGGEQQSNPAGPVTLQTWNHLVGVFNGTDIFIYLNGQPQGAPVQFVGAFADTTADFLIGNTPDNGTPFRGIIDEVRVWNQTLSDADVYQAYISNLRKYDTDRWEFLYNETDVTYNSPYTYQAYTTDLTGKSNATELRQITFLPPPPDMAFVDPSPEEGDDNTLDFVVLNVSVSDSDLYNLTFRYNTGQNYTDYGEDVLLWLNFNNLSSLGENRSIFRDISHYNHSIGCKTAAGECPTYFPSQQNPLGQGMMRFESSAVVNVTHHEAFNNSDAITIIIRTNSVSTGSGIEGGFWYEDVDFGSNLYNRIGTNGDDVLASLTINATRIDLDSGPQVLTSGGSNFIALSWNGSFAFLYIDGSTHDTADAVGKLNHSKSSKYIGGTQPGNSFTGFVDEIIIYNRSMSTTELEHLRLTWLQKTSATEYFYFTNVTDIQQGNQTARMEGWNFAGSNDTVILNFIKSNYDGTPPRLNYGGGTPQNNSNVSGESVEVYVDVQDDRSNVRAIVDFNSTLRGWWRLNNETGENATLFRDWSSYGANGTCLSCPTMVYYGSIPEAYGWRYLFNGSSYINLTNASSFQMLGDQDFSVVLQAKKNGTITSGFTGAFSYGARTPSEPGYALGFNNTHVIFLMGNGSSRINISCNAGFTAESFRTYGITVDRDGNATLFLDSTPCTAGVNVSAYNVTLASNASGLIGAFTGIGDGFNGSIDGVQFYSRLLNNSDGATEMSAADDSGTYVNVFRGLSAGRYYFQAYADDYYGNVEEGELRTFWILDQIPPSVNFTLPTPENGTTVSEDYLLVNVSSSDNLINHSVIVNWNETLLGWFRFNNETGENTSFFLNNGSYGYNITCINSSLCPSKTAGPLGSALHFRNVEDEQADFLNMTSFPGGSNTSFSVIAWVKTGSDQGGVIVEQWNNSGASSSKFTLRIHHDTAWCEGRLGPVSPYLGLGSEAVKMYLITNETMLNDSAWHQLAFTWKSGDSFLLYVDGKRTPTQGLDSSLQDGPCAGNPLPEKINTPAINLIVGQDFNGSIDDVQIYSRWLSGEEINASYQAHVYPYLNNFTNLSEGNYTFTAYAQDLEGNLNQTETRLVTVEEAGLTVAFGSGAEANNSVLNRKHAVMNITVENAPSLQNFSFFWNGTEIPFYDPSLVLMLSFDNLSALGDSNTQVTDLSQYGNTVSCSTCPPGPEADGKYGGRWIFNGTQGDLRRTSSYSSLEMHNSSFTISAWFYLNSTPNNYRVIYSKGAFGGSGYGMSINVNGRLTADIQATGGSNQHANSAATAVNINQWQHGLIIFNKTDTMRFYVNGVNVYNASYDSGNTGNVSNPSANVRVGLVGGSFLFNGSIDELRIWNRTLTDEEAKWMYYGSLRKYDSDKWELFANATGLQEGDYTFSAQATDTTPTRAESGTRTLTIIDYSPSWNSNSTSAPGKIGESKHFATVWTDDLGLSAAIFSWNGSNGSWVNYSAVPLVGLQDTANTTKVLNVSRGNIIGWKYYANDSINQWNETAVFTFEVENTPPSAVNLSAPANGSTVTNRRPVFNWTPAYDPDGDFINYTIIIDEGDNCASDGLECIEFTINGSTLNLTNFTPSQFLGLDTYYNWTVKAFDGTNYSEWSGMFNFTLEGLLSLSLDCEDCNANVDFGNQVFNGLSYNTTQDNPVPLIVENNGNVFTDIRVNATQLWSSVSLDTPYFQFRAGNASEAGSFNWSNSTTVFTNMGPTLTPVIGKLNFSNASNLAEIELLIRVPNDETAGKKETTITVEARYGG